MRTAELVNRLQEETGVLINTKQACRILKREGITDHIVGSRTNRNGRSIREFDFRQWHLDILVEYMRQPRIKCKNQYRNRVDPTEDEIREMCIAAREKRPRPKVGATEDHWLPPMIARDRAW